MKIKDVVEFMLKELEENGVLYQKGLVNTIQEKFGNEFIFTNSHGTLSIDRKVIREFNKLKGEDIHWDKESCSWL